MSTAMSVADDAAVAWTPPGPGVWESDRLHQARPFTTVVADLWPGAFSDGFAEAFRRYGFPLETLDARVVHGYAFVRPKVVGEPASGPRRGEPPAWILRLVMRLVPELRRRNATAVQALAERRWLADADAWVAERDGWADRFRARQAVDLDLLDDAALADELEVTGELTSGMLRRHFALAGLGLGLGDLLLAASGWHLDPEEVAGLLEGSSPSSQATRVHMRRLAGALRDAGVDVAGLADAHAADPAAALDVVRGASPVASSALDDYLTDHGWRATDNTAEAPVLAERPDLVVRALVAAAAEDDAAVAAAADRVAAAEARQRGRVPVAERERFDRLLADARRVYAVTDEVTSYVLWAAGVMRRVGVAVGRRLAADGRLHDAGHVVDATTAELAAALRGEADGLADRAATRHAERAVLVAGDVRPPTSLGGEPAPPPPLDVLPAGLAGVVARFEAYRRLRAPSAADELAAAGRVLVGGEIVGTGHAVGEGRYTGRACVARSVEDALERLEPGDVLVCPLTSPSHDPLFTIAGAVVTEEGGPMGHTAVMARETGVPAVVGTGTVAIVDGDEVTVIVTGPGPAPTPAAGPASPSPDG
ncbi:MAG: PEP-utilizing enzyme [Acidimicrobiales bacterium]